eukprot:gene17865-21301_t
MGLFYKKTLSSFIKPKIFDLIILLFSAFTLINTLFFQKILTFNTYALTTESILLIIFSLCWFVFSMNGEESITKNSDASLRLDWAYFFLGNHVHLFLYRHMEETKELSFLGILLPVTILLFIICTAVIFLVRRFQRNFYQQQLDKEALKLMHQKELLSSTIQVQEKERKRIATDLHDELGAALSIIRMQLMQLEQQNQHQSAVIPATALASIRNIDENALSSLRRICHELMPVHLETFGLLESLKSTAAQFSGKENINLELEFNPEEARYPKLIELHLYRILMELINNTLKYAEASLICIKINNINQSLRVEYSDNGKGLPIKKDPSKTGLGFQNMEARINVMNGNYHIDTNLSEGMAVRFEIPLPLTS